MIPKETIRRVAEATDIVGYIGIFVKLKRNGKNYIGLCPFHQEKSPSFFVTPQKNIYKCFGCGAYGNVISFATNYENLSFVEAVKKIAAYSGITIVEETRIKSEQKTIEERCFEDTLDFFREQLKKCSSDSPVGKLIGKRKLSAYIIDKYNVGFAPDNWHSLLKYLTEKKYPEELLLKHSLIKKSENNRTYDFYRNRLIFPIRDISGSITGFGARALGDDLPKYINPAETPLYSKSNILYGLYEAAPSARKNSRIIITEGYIDVLRMAQQGFDDTVALCGTALTDGHIRIFRHLRTPKVLILPDGDSAGANSALKSAKLLIVNNIPGYICTLENGMDPGDFFDKYPTENMQHILDRAVESPYFIISQSKMAGGNADSNVRIKSMEELVEFSAGIPPERRSYFLDITAETYGINRLTIESLHTKGLNKNSSALSLPEKYTEASDVPANDINFLKIKELYPRDFNIIECLITGHVTVEQLSAIYPADMFQDTYLKRFYKRITQLEKIDLLQLEDEDLRECFPEFENLIDFLTIFSDNRLKLEPAEKINSILFELMQKNLFELYSVKSKVMDYDKKKSAFLNYKDQIEQLQYILLPHLERKKANDNA